VTYAPVGSQQHTTASGALATFSFTTTAIGDFVLAIIGDFGGTRTPTALSSTNCTWTAIGTAAATSAGPGHFQAFLGNVTATGAATVTITWGAGTTGSFEASVAQEFSTNTGLPVIDKQGNVDNGSGVAVFPSLTPVASGELYFGYAFNTGTGSGAGSTSGYTYGTDGSGNNVLYNAACSGSAQAPTTTDTGNESGLAILVKPTVPAAGTGPGNFQQLMQDVRFRSLIRRRSVSAFVPNNMLLTGVGGTNGVALTTSDPVSDPFDLMTVGTGATFQYDSSHGSNQGCQSVQVATSGTSAASNGRWQSTWTNSIPGPNLWASACFYFTANPAAQITIMEFRRDGDLAGPYLKLNSTGKFIIADTSNTNAATSVTSIPLNSEFRLEFSASASDGVGGFVEARLFLNPSGTVPDEVITAGGLTTTAAGARGLAGLRAGIVVAAASVGPYWMWAVQASNVGYPAPLATTGGPTTSIITLADTGAGSDTLVDSAAITLADSGTAAEAYVMAATLALADVGAGADTLVDSAVATLTDTGAGADTIPITAPITLTDSGSGSDAIVDSATISLTQSGVGSDAVSVNATIGLSDSGGGSDSVVDSAAITLPDTGSAAEAIVAAITAVLAETGLGTDSVSVSIAGATTITLSDSGTGTDVVSVVVSLALADTGAGSDAISVSATISLPDTGAGSDAVSDSAVLALSDIGLASDAITAIISAVLSDTGIGTDSISVVTGGITKTLSDSGIGTDAIVAAVTVALNDMGEGIDSVVQYVRLQESGQGSDSVFVTVVASLSDSGQGADILQAWPVSVVSLLDAGAGTDTIVALLDNQNTVALSDSGSGADTLSLSQVVSLADTGIGSDTIHVDVQVWLGYDDPVAEHHEPFDPFAPELEKMAVAITESRPYSLRSGMTVVPQVWRMTELEFIAHVDQMHPNWSIRGHAAAHRNGEGGEPRHIHR